MFRNILRTLIEPFPAAASFYRSSRDLLDRNKPSRQTPWGFKLAGNDSMALGQFEPEETEIVRALLEHADLFVNIGANIGYYCCHALSLGKSVIAIEPIQSNVHYLLRNALENSWQHRIEVLPVALGAQTDVLEMYGGGTGASLVKGWAGSPASYKRLVPIITLDRILEGVSNSARILILIDAEGAELDVLRGATKTASRLEKPIWMVEINSVQHQPKGISINPNLKETFEFFFSKGYHSITADKNSRQITQGEVDAAASNTSTLGSYNFVFSHTTSPHCLTTSGIDVA
jgi:FkbM family methyltransferase